MFKFGLSHKDVISVGRYFIHNFLLLCLRDAVTLFNFISEHFHLAPGQHGANLLLRSFVPGRSFS